MKVLVLSTPDPIAVVDHLTLLGLTFVKEQHGEGPVHWSCQRDESVLEVYPRPPSTLAQRTSRVYWIDDDGDPS